jgi:hypothetical protein
VSAIRETLDGLQLSGRERDVANAISRLTHGAGLATARLTQLQIRRASGRSGKDLNRVLAKLEKSRILVYESGPDGTRYWLNPRTQDWAPRSILNPREWDDLVAEVRVANVAAQRKLDLVTEQPSLASVVADVAHSAEDCTIRESAVGIRDRETLRAGADSRSPLPSPQSSARSGNPSLRERVQFFVGRYDYDKYWALRPDLFEPPKAELLEGALRYCKSGLASGEVRVLLTRGAMLWDAFKRAWSRACGAADNAADVARGRPGGCQASPENRANTR